MNRKYNIAIIPPETIAKQAVAMSERISAEGAYFVLDGTSLYPHISLYHVVLDDEHLSEIVQAVTDAVSSIQSFTLKSGPYRTGAGEWIDVSYEREKGIMVLHEVVIGAVASRRTNKKSEKNRADWEALEEVARQNIERCGWADAFEHYAPHLTFARLQTQDANILTRLPIMGFTFPVQTIGLFEMGEHGACTKLLHTFWLSENSKS